MRLSSFKIQITLLSAAISGLVLLGFAAWSWRLMYTAGLERIDRELVELGQRHLTVPQRPEHWASLEESLQLVFGQETASLLTLYVADRNGREIHRSQSWPFDGPLRSVVDFDTVFSSMPAPPPFPGPAPEPRKTGNPSGRFPPPHDEEFRPPPPPGELSWPPPDGRGGFRKPPPGGRGEFRGPPPGGRDEFPGPPFGGRAGRGFRSGPRQDAPQLLGPLPPDSNDQWAPDEQESPPFRPRPPRDRFGPRRDPLPLSKPIFASKSTNDGDWRLGVMANPHIVMVLATDLERFHSDMARARVGLGGALLFACLLIGCGGWLISKRALRPVQALSDTARRITAKGLDQRIPSMHEAAEFQDLISVFNGMLDRLEKSFGQAVRFSADAAHELKTPLTILQGELEQALRGAPEGSEGQRIYSMLLDEVQRLKNITRKLLLLSTADAGKLTINAESLNLSEMVENVCDDAEILAPNLELQKKIEPDLWIQGDRDLVRQVFQNLTNNAIKFNRKGGKIRFHLRRETDAIRFSVANTGESIPRSERERIFERFYRTDESRNRKVGGAGLGLSLSREIMRAHGGELVVDETPEGVTSFTATFPACWKAASPTA